jgi:hypothetical protein
MFEGFILRVLVSSAGRRQIERIVREVLEDPTSSTRRGMMRIIRGVAKDAVEEVNERQLALAELDTEYVQWSQQRREALLEQQTQEKAALVALARSGEMPALPDALEQFRTGGRVRVVSDALFENKYGNVLGTARSSSGFPEVTVLLDHHHQPMQFTPAALQLLDDVQDAEQGDPTEMLPKIEP